MAAMAIPRARPTPVEAFFQISLLGLLASSTLAVVGSGSLDLSCTLFSILGLLLRGLMITGAVRFTLSSRLVAAATLLYIGFYPLDILFFSQEFMRATIHLLFFVGSVKVVTATSDRDYRFVAVIAFLQLLAATVLSARVNFFLFLGLFLLFAIATFSSAEIRRAASRPVAVSRFGGRAMERRLATLSLTIALGILILTAGLFFLLPRTARAALQHLALGQGHLPGFSNQVTLGQTGRIQDADTPVMHVRMLHPEQPMTLKWRGASLAEFDGKRWSALPLQESDRRPTLGGVARLTDEGHTGPGQRIHYEVRVQPATADALFFAGVPEVVSVPARQIRGNADDGFRLGGGFPDGLRYTAFSYLPTPGAGDARTIAPLTTAQRDTYLSVDPSVHPEVRALARRITMGVYEPGQRARLIEQYLRKNFTYTLELLDHEVPDPLYDFLFQRRKGHCEYFASAMAIMLRAVDIPARVATGFQGGVYNPVSGWQIIRASDAHSWVEAYLPGSGWTTFDPTPPDLRTPGVGVWSRLNFYFDAADTFWQEWVLNYDLEHQAGLAMRMDRSRNGDHWSWWWELCAAALRFKVRAVALGRQYGAILGALLVLAVALTLILPPLWNWVKARRRLKRLRRGKGSASDATLLYERMLRQLSARGLDKPACVTPLEFARVLPPSETAVLVQELTSAYNALRFGHQADAAPRLAELLEQLEKA